MKDHWQEAAQYIKTVTGSVPAHRRASKYRYSFSSGTFQQQLAVWNQVWHNADDFWMGTHAFFFLEQNIQKEGALKLMWPIVVKWQDRINDWPLCGSGSS